MLKTLVKKQFMEIFKGYFFDVKKNAARTKKATIGYFIFFFCMLFIAIGGSMAGLALLFAPTFSAMDLGWLFFLIFGGLALIMGLFGSVFSTYSSLYLAKDNEMLLSMPIPVKTIIASRLINVYLIGLIYELPVLLPATLVWFFFTFDFMALLGGLVYFVGISVIVLTLTCLLGWLVAKISLKIKNRNFIKVFVALVGIGIYYFVYFQINQIITDLIENAFIYGAAIKESAYALYLFGACGAGYWLSLLIMLALSAGLLVFTIWFISAGFIKIATSTAQVESVVYKEKRAKERSLFKNLLSRELLRFKSSANYMLNCGLGCLMLPAAGIAMLIFKDQMNVLFEDLTYGAYSAWPVLFMVVSGFMAGMNFYCAPSVSLEGKSVWVIQSLPLNLKDVIKAKILTQIILTLPAIWILDLCFVIAFPIGVMDAIMLFVVSTALELMYACFYMVLGLKFSNNNWVNEIFVIKQGAAAGLSCLICFVAPGILFAPGFITVMFMPLWPLWILTTAVLMLVTWLTYRWCMKRGPQIIAEL